MNTKLSNIAKFYAYTTQLAAGGQPTEEQIHDIKSEGYEAIINISTPSARNFLHTEAKMVEELGLDYVHFPVDCSNLRPLHYTTFKGIMDAFADKKVFIHCGGNIKTSNLLHMYHVIEKKAEEQDSLNTLKQIQDPEQKWFDYFKTFGMLGLS